MFLRYIIITILPLLLFSFDINTFINKIQKQSNQTLKKVDNNKTFLDKISKSANYNASLNLYKKYFSNDNFTIENYPKVFNKDALIKRRTILFYLFTTNMPEESYLNVFRQAELIKDKLPVIGVLRGMDLKTKKKLDKAFKNKKIVFNGRVNPFIFRDLNIKKAPVFIVANCQIKPYLKYKSCKFLYRFDGDVTLSYALTKIGEYNDEVRNISMVFYK